MKLLAPSADSLRAVLARVSRVVPLDSGDISEVLRRFQTARYQPVVVFGDATFETVSKLEEHRVALPGLVIQAEPKRLYPGGPGGGASGGVRRRGDRRRSGERALRGAQSRRHRRESRPARRCRCAWSSPRSATPRDVSWPAGSCSATCRRTWPTRRRSRRGITSAGGSRACTNC